MLSFRCQRCGSAATTQVNGAEWYCSSCLPRPAFVPATCSCAASLARDRDVWNAAVEACAKAACSRCATFDPLTRIAGRDGYFHGPRCGAPEPALCAASAIRAQARP